MNEVKNSAEFQQLAHLRVHDAKVLLDNNCYAGAYYLLGYAVECALKACIAKRIKRFTFPARDFVRQVYTHDLKTLVKSADLELELGKIIKANPSFDDSWNVVKEWKESSRYSGAIPERTARDFYIAVTHRRNGVLTWLKKHW